jgi:TPP-dependent pyruvate/acetoin dehydrogenase alpha subunit
MEGIYHDADLNDSTEPSSDTIAVDSRERPDQDFINHPINRELEAEEKIRLYSQMLRIRRFEERSLRA